MDYLRSLAAAHADKSIFQDIINLHQKQLWYQVSAKLLTALKDPFFEGEQLVTLYDKYVSTVAKKLKPLDLAVFSAAATKHKDAPSAIEFLESVQSVVEGEDAQTLLLLETARLQMTMLDWSQDTVKATIRKAKAKMDAYSGTFHGLVYSTYYRTLLEFYKLEGSSGEYYKNAMLFLAYTPLEQISPAEQVKLAADIGLATIVGSTVYNFGELLQHPIVEKLQGTEYEWLHKLLFIFNKGDISGFTACVEEEEKSSNKTILTTQRPFLNQKIRIMALMELVFNLSKDNRKISFATIAAECQLPDSEVELLVMKAFSLKVLKGSINQLDQEVQVTWVQPRVLVKDQLIKMNERLKEWATNVHEMGKYVEANAPDILAQKPEPKLRRAPTLGSA